MRWRRHQQAHLRHGGTVRLLPHAHEMVAPHLGGEKDIERRAADESTMACRRRTGSLATAYGLCNIVRNLTRYATFGTSSRTTCTSTSSHASGGGKAWSTHTLSARRQNRQYPATFQQCQGHSVTSVCNYIMKPRRHPSLTMIDGTITIYSGPIPGVRIDRAM